MTAVVYRVYDAVDRLLYVGSTSDYAKRRADHRSGYGNPTSLDLIIFGRRWETAEYPSLNEARAAEAQAIHDEVPAFNRQHNTARYARQGTQFVLTGEPYEHHPA